jgi:hypothetical protein
MSDTPSASALADPRDGTLATLSASPEVLGFFAKFRIKEPRSLRWLRATAMCTPKIWAQGIIVVAAEGRGSRARAARARRGQNVNCMFEGRRFISTVGTDSPKPRMLWLFAPDLLDAVFGAPLLGSDEKIDLARPESRYSRVRQSRRGPQALTTG